MDGIKFIPGIQWAADILEGLRPIPTNKSKPEKRGGKRMKGLFIPEITAEMFRNGCLESIEALMAEGEIHDIDYPLWIPVSERLPEEKINPITEDFYEYQCTYHAYGIYDVRSYKFGDGHWWHGPGIMDDSVIAWRPLPEPYVPDNNVGEKEEE